MPTSLVTLGWREWVALPDLGLPAIKAKVDTGARTSALHAFKVDRFKHKGSDWVRFEMHPMQKNTKKVIECKARLLDQRIVTDSGGHREKRNVIETQLVVADQSWPIELTLTNRDTMLFRMLLGREAMSKKILVNPAKSYLAGKLDAKTLYRKP